MLSKCFLPNEHRSKSSTRTVNWNGQERREHEVSQISSLLERRRQLKVAVDLCFVVLQPRIFSSFVFNFFLHLQFDISRRWTVFLIFQKPSSTNKNYCETRNSSRHPVDSRKFPSELARSSLFLLPLGRRVFNDAAPSYASPAGRVRKTDTSDTRRPARLASPLLRPVSRGPHEHGRRRGDMGVPSHGRRDEGRHSWCPRWPHSGEH